MPCDVGWGVICVMTMRSGRRPRCDDRRPAEVGSDFFRVTFSCCLVSSLRGGEWNGMMAGAAGHGLRRGARRPPRHDPQRRWVGEYRRRPTRPNRREGKGKLATEPPVRSVGRRRLDPPTRRPPITHSLISPSLPPSAAFCHSSPPSSGVDQNHEHLHLKVRINHRG